MNQVSNIQFSCDSDLEAYRFVTITPSTDKAAYTAAGQSADAITVGASANGKVALQMLSDTSKSFTFEAGGTISLGQSVQVGTSGKGVVQSSGIAVCICKLAAIDGSWSEGYNKARSLQALDNVGTAESYVTATEEGEGFKHKTTLVIDTVLPAIAGGASLGVGKKLYTLPAGAKVITASRIALKVTQTEGHITADTPDGGLGTTIASGVIATLDADAAFENILTGQTFNNCNGTVENKSLGTVLPIESADSHIVYFNIADGWAASGDAAAKLEGTVVLEWSSL